MTVEPTPLEAARRAAEGAEWDDAYRLLVQTDMSQALSGPDLPLLADVAYNAGHIDVAIDAWERAYAESLRAADKLGAAGAAVQTSILLLFDTALMAPIRGWLKRAERLLEDSEDTPVHVWLAVVRTYERLLSGDLQSARESANRAMSLGETHDPGGVVVGRIALARLEILEGNVEEGVNLLNEAAVAAVSGELALMATGIVFCEVLCGLQAIAQYDLAEQWAEAFERWHPGKPVGSLHGRCRVHKAEVLRMRGDYEEAQSEILQACEELRPYLRREFGWPLNELGRIRYRLGNVKGAKEAFLAAHQAGWDPQPGLAMTHLAEGDVSLALASIRDALTHPMNVPSKEWPPNTELRRAPLLEACVEIALAANDLESAREAAEEMGAIARRFQSSALAGSAGLARGRVRLKEGDLPSARSEFESALQSWTDAKAPYETALARLGLGEVHRAEGHEERALMELRAAQSEFERIGAIRDAARAEALMSSALEAPISGGSERSEALSGECQFKRHGDFWVVGLGGHKVHIRDRKGLHYIARLLSVAGREIHVLELASHDGNVSSGDDGGTYLALAADRGAGELLDATAKEAYRRRLAEIDEDLAEARSFNDPGRIQQAEGERAFLVQELARAVGWSGRSRPAGSASERARVSVTRAIRQALEVISSHHPALAAHLRGAIRTGTFCAYCPDPGEQPEWVL